jgi:hypothetical protein
VTTDPEPPWLPGLAIAVVLVFSLLCLVPWLSELVGAYRWRCDVDAGCAERRGGGQSEGP